jgi:hypothetical protein
MAILTETPNFPAPTNEWKKDRTPEERITELEQIVKSLIQTLDGYSYISKKYSEAGIVTVGELEGTLDDLADGTTFAKIRITDTDGSGNIEITSSSVTDVEANATNGATWGSNLGSIPTRFTDSTPGSGSGLIMTATTIGLYKEGAEFEGSVSGTFENGELVTQTGTGATGYIHDIVGSRLTVSDETGIWNGSGTLTGQKSGATLSSLTDYDNVQVYTVYIENSGDFRFHGDGDNYIAWDGTTINIVCEQGLVGDPSNSHYNITDGTLQLSTTGYVNTKGKGGLSDSNAGVFLGYDGGYGLECYQDANNYFRYDPGASPAFEIKTQKGRFGSTTDYFDASTGTLQSGTGSTYVQIYNSRIDARYSGYDTFVVASGNTTARGLKVPLGTTDGNNENECSIWAVSDVVRVGFQSDSMYLEYDDTGGSPTFKLLTCELQSCGVNSLTSSPGNNTLWYNSSTSKLVYTDPGGTDNNLY